MVWIHKPKITRNKLLRLAVLTRLFRQVNNCAEAGVLALMCVVQIYVLGAQQT